MTTAATITEEQVAKAAQGAKYANVMVLMHQRQAQEASSDEARDTNNEAVAAWRGIAANKATAANKIEWAYASQTATAGPAEIPVSYRKTRNGEWVVFGPVTEVIEGYTVTVTLKNGTTKNERITSTGKTFTVDGVDCCYGRKGVTPRSYSETYDDDQPIEHKMDNGQVWLEY